MAAFLSFVRIGTATEIYENRSLEPVLIIKSDTPKKCKGTTDGTSKILTH
jgi:hypothetical protein